MSQSKKYNVLINGRNMAIVMDFITHSEVYFKCLSTSDCWQDVLGHFELFKPDVYLCFVDSIYSKILTQTNALRGDSKYNDAPIFVVADEETYNELEQNPRPSISVVIKRPISTDNLILRITAHLEQRAKIAEIEAEKEAKRLEELEKRKEAAKRGRKDEPEEETESFASLRETWEKEIMPIDVTPAKISAPVKLLEPEKEKPPVKEGGGKKHILIVDDDRTVLKMLKSALEEEYDVTTMVNGLMVEKFLMAKEVDLVILDYEMPGMTGADIFRKIRANGETDKIPVCFLTGISDREKILEVMALKPNSYLLKPIEMDMLKAAITNLTHD
ncbi:MAG: response regulator [Bacteroides sp.]|nr:response regulator [Bacteroides sp.]